MGWGKCVRFISVGKTNRKAIYRERENAKICARLSQGRPTWWAKRKKKNAGYFRCIVECTTQKKEKETGTTWKLISHTLDQLETKVTRKDKELNTSWWKEGKRQYSSYNSSYKSSSSSHGHSLVTRNPFLSFDRKKYHLHFSPRINNQFLTYHRSLPELQITKWHCHWWQMAIAKM